LEGITAVRRRDQPWLIHIAPVEMQGACEVIKFVTAAQESPTSTFEPGVSDI
jgi:hypothetical protein